MIIRIMLFFFVLFAICNAVIVRIPVETNQDRDHVLGYYGVHPQRFISDSRGGAYLAVVDDGGSFEVYNPPMDWGDSSCIQLETMTEIPMSGFWKRRVTGPFTAEIEMVPEGSEARERVLRAENIVSIHPCIQKETYDRIWYDTPMSIRQTSTIVQLQEWADKNRLTGKNSTVMLVDTGINYKHMQFGSSSKEPFTTILNNEPFVKGVSENPRVEAILMRKSWDDDWMIPDEYVRSCMIVDLEGHGTHCSGILAGQSGSVGLAGESKIIMVNGITLKSTPGEPCATNKKISGISYYDLRFIMEAGYEPAVISNSWGGPIVNPDLYTGENYYHDQFVYEHPSVLLLFAAGNGGQEYFNTQTLAHNVLSVGSARDDFGMSDFSSAGPMIDRRGHMTVHVVTNGQSVLSADGFHDRDHVIKSGTSMSTPLAAGIATLLRERLIRGGTEKPSGSLLRTLLVHCAVPLSGVDSSAQGFGFLQPALITDHGWIRTLETRLNIETRSREIVNYVARRNEIFRVTAGWYTTPGTVLENVANLVCTRNGVTRFNRTDPLNSLIRMTFHLLVGDRVSCHVEMVRAKNNVGFDVSVAVSGWPTLVIYMKEDVVGTDAPNPLLGLWFGSAGEIDIYTEGVPLIYPAPIWREWARDAVSANPLWYLFGACMGLGIVIVTCLICFVVGVLRRRPKDHAIKSV
jgi:hypothetical protein